MNTRHKRTVLVVDDDDINLMILIKTTQDAGYTPKSFSSGEAAWDYLRNYPGEADIALLDKMMPGTNGLELLKLIKNDKSLKDMPVIIQTGDVGMDQMREGLESGAYYYLAKPFTPEILAAILHSAANECTMRESLRDHMTAGQTQLINLLQQGEFSLKTHEDAHFLAALLSEAAVHPEFVALGLMELLANAIEHGNLEIGYELKRRCLLVNNWAEELAERLKRSRYCHRAVHVCVNKIPGGMHISIKDEGQGFDWQRYVHGSGEAVKLNEPNGRGIRKALIMLDDIRYAGNGNEVHCNISLPTQLMLVDRTASPSTLRM